MSVARGCQAARAEGGQWREPRPPEARGAWRRETRAVGRGGRGIAHLTAAKANKGGASVAPPERRAEGRHMRRAGLAVVLLALLLAAAPAHAVKRACSPTGDVCYGAFGIGSHVRLRVTLAGNLFHTYKLCVRAPDGSRTCRQLHTWPIAHGLYQSTVHWRAHFPNKGPGRYRATWKAGGGAFRPGAH